MKGKVIGALAAVVLFVVGYLLGGAAASARMRSETMKLKGEVEIYKSEADRYAQILRNIRSTATEAMVTEKAL